MTLQTDDNNDSETYICLLCVWIIIHFTNNTLRANHILYFINDATLMTIFAVR